VEVTCVDTALGNFIRGNDFRFVDFSTIRPQYTNLIGERGQQVVGVFGSATSQQTFVKMTDCTLARLNLRDRTAGAPPTVPVSANCAE